MLSEGNCHDRCYQAIKEKNLLKGFMLRIYEELYTQGPLTSGEVEEALSKNDKRGRNETAKRIYDLYTMGVVEPSGGMLSNRSCAISRRKNKIWRLTGDIPKPREERKTTKQKLERLEQLEQEVKSLKPDLLLLLRHLSFLKVAKESEAYGRVEQFYNRH